MAIKKKSGGGGGGANWMDTYGDMVTLLLCFFVLLYSMSTVDENKWKALVQSFNPAGVITQIEDIQGGSGPSADENQGGGVFDNPDAQEAQEEINNMLEEIVEAIQQMAAQEGLEGSISAEFTDGKVYVHFGDTVFFAGDSYDLTRQGQEVLLKVSAILENGKKAIEEIRVQGHTAQKYDDRPNGYLGDRRLASNRSMMVVVFLMEHTTIHPARMVNEGFGQWRPIGNNQGETGKAPNRRVEMIISGVDLANSELGDALNEFIDMGGISEESLEQQQP
ncbi:MAG: flagellar motor protein MotB [Clostridiales bacterium]|nr:flagellar motor protein MotB [Clostridiales bacterium]